MSVSVALTPPGGGGGDNLYLTKYCYKHAVGYNNKKNLKNVGPIRHCEPPHAHSPGVATVARRLRINVHDNDDDDDNNNDNDNA